MIVQDLSAALDRRLQVDRIAILDRTAPVAGAGDGPSGTTSDALSGRGASARTDAAPGSLGARLPLGQIVLARVVDVPTPELLIAELDDLRVELAWPPGGSALPRAGDDVALRVLAHEPMLVLQNVTADELATAASGDPAGDASTSTDARWSSDALQLQRGAGLTGQALADVRATGAMQAAEAGSGHGPVADAAGTAAGAAGSPVAAAGGAVRFDVPILHLERVFDDVPAATAESDTDAGTRPPRNPAPTLAIGPGTGPSPASAGPPPLHASAGGATAPMAESPVGPRDVATVDGQPAPLVPRSTHEPLPPTPFVPLVLQGPAWPGQPIELVVRRERDDPALDNPVLDQWCGEVVIDLPQLGRVAGHLSFSMQGLRVRLEADDDASVAAMTAAAAELAAGFADADLRVAGLTVAHPSADATRPSAAIARAARRTYRDGDRDDA